MTAQQVLNFLNKLPKEDLKKQVLFNSELHSISGHIKNITKQPFNLYWNGDDDPATLYTKSELKSKLDMDKEEIEECVLEIAKGDIVINL